MPSPHSRRAFVAVTSLVTLAGCIGDNEILGPDTGTSSGESQLPPGVSDDGLDDHETLLASHREQLLSDGFTLELEIEDESGDGYEYSLETGSDGEPFELSGSIERGDELETVDLWVTESQAVGKTDRGDGPRYLANVRGYDVVDDFVVPYELREAVETGSFAVDGMNDPDGTTLVAEEVGSDAVSAATLVVDQRGVIREAALDLVDSTGMARSMTYEILAVGAGDLTEPTWITDVPDSVFDDVDVSVDPSSGDALELVSRGDDPVPAGTTVTVDDGDATYRVAVERQLATGERVYIWIRDGSLTVSDDPPSTVDARFSSPITVSVVSPDDVAFVQASMGWASSSSSEGGSDGSAGSTGSSSSG